MNARLLLAAWLAVAILAGLAIAAATRHNTARSRPALPRRQPGATAAIQAEALDRLRTATDLYLIYPDPPTWPEEDAA